MGNLWAKKHQPSASEVGVGKMEELRKYLAAYRPGSKGLLLHGPTGSGKTSSVYAIAKEKELEIVELNASDFRDAESITSIAGSASRQMSLFAKGKIILIDELDGVSGQQDRGGIPAIEELIAKSAFPIVLTANDALDRKFDSLRKKCVLVEFHPVVYNEIYSIIKRIADIEKITYDEQSLKALSLRAGGDIRAAINDMQLIAEGTRIVAKDDVDKLSERNREAKITDALLRIFRSTDMIVALSSLDNLDEQIEKVMMWIDENLPSEYGTHDLKAAYESMSKADVYLGRIRNWQHWRFLVYANALISAGVALAKSGKAKGAAGYKQSTRPLKIYIAGMKNAKAKSISEKLALKSNVSNRRARSQLLPFLKEIFKHKEFARKISSELELAEEESSWLSR